MDSSLWIVGFHAVMDALGTPESVEAVWVQKGRRDHRVGEVMSAARAHGIRFKQVERSRLDVIADGVPHNGCAVRRAPIGFADLDDLLEHGLGAAGVVLLDGVQDPHNLGSVIRSAAAFGVSVVVLAGHAVPPLGGAVAKAAAGNLGRVNFVRANVAADALQTLKDAGFWTLGADMKGTPVRDLELPGRWVICLGEEQRGLKAKTRSQIDELVAIPIAEDVESLNLSVSAGILLYHLTQAS